MRVYIAAAFARKNEIAEKSQELENLGIKVTSTWPWEDAAPNSTMDEVGPEYLKRNARKDLNETVAADAIILFTQSPEKPFVRGGRMHEAGFAQAAGKSLLICGPRENIFHYL